MNKLLEELADEFGKSHIPDDAITGRMLAEKLDIHLRNANKILYEKFLNGELTREKKWDGTSTQYYYWKSDD
jgi:hypothetical protein